MKQEKDNSHVSNYVNEMNALALAENLHDLRLQYDERLRILENKILILEDLYQKQAKVLNEALVMAYGKGSTVKE